MEVKAERPSLGTTSSSFDLHLGIGRQRALLKGELETFVLES